MTDREPPSFGSYRPQHGAPPPPRGLHPGPRPAPPSPRRPAGPPHGRYPPRRSGLFRWLLIGVIGLAGFATVGVVLLVAFAPTAYIRDQLIVQVKRTTGRDLIVKGQTSLSLFPAISVAMGDVTLSPPPGMTGPPSVRIDKLQADIPLLPLIRRELQIERLVLTRPVFDVRIDKSGRRSWDFASAMPPSEIPVRYAQAATTRTDAGLPSPVSKALGPIGDIALGDIRIIDGRLRYSDERSASAEEIRAIDLLIQGNRLADPLAAKGNLTWRGERLGFAADLASPRAVLSAAPARVKLRLVGGRFGADLDGTLNSAAALAFDGDARAETKSLRALATWLGGNLPAVDGFGPAKVAGRLSARADTITLRSANLALDKTTAAGDIAVSLAGARPSVRATLSLDVLDLNDYLPSEPDGSAPPTGTPGRPPAAVTEQPGVKSIDDLLRRDEARPDRPARFAPQVRGYTRRDGWSEAPLDLAAFHALDATAKLSVGRLLFRDVKVGRSNLDVTLQKAVMQAHLREMALYEGRGVGQIRIDAAGAVPQVAAVFSLDGLAALSFLQDATGFDWIDGKTKVQLSVTAQGPSQKAMISALDGKASLAFADGAIIGYDLPLILEQVQQGRIPGFERDSGRKTDFTSLTVSYQIANGIASSKDLKLASRLLRATGEGTVSLPAQHVDYLLRPKLGAEGSPPSGGQAPTSLEIPLKVKGPWAKPRVTPDLGAVVKNPGGALEVIKQLGAKLKNQKGVSETLDKLFGKRGGEGGGNEGGGSGPDGGTAPGTGEAPAGKPSGKDLLRQLFR